MATTKRVQAAKRNVKKARAGAQKKRSIATMPAPHALGKQGAAVAKRKHTGGTSPKTHQELYEEAKRRDLPGRSKGASGSSRCSRGSASSVGSPAAGLDWAEPFCTSQAVSSTYTPICRNSDSQFSNVASPKSRASSAAPCSPSAEPATTCR
jgi:hypothetical protein